MQGSYSQFCEYMGYKSKSYVNKLKKEGRLVFIGGLIDFEKSKAKINGTADISRENASDKQTQPRNQTISSSNDQPNDTTGLGAKQQYGLAQTAEKIWSAKKKKLEFEQASGKLGSLDQIQKIGFGIGKIIKTRLSTLAIRAAPVVTNETSERKNLEYLLNETDKILSEIMEAISCARNTNVES